MSYTAGLAADLLPDRYGVVFVPHRHTRRFVRPIKETGKRPRPDRMGLGLFFCKACRKIMPPGGARVLRSAHHDAAVVFGGAALSGAFAPLPGLRLPASASLSLASCWPRPQQLLPVSAAGGGRRRCSQRERLWQVGPLPTGRLRRNMAQKGGPCYRGQPLLDNAPCQAAVNLDSGALPFPRHRASLVQRGPDRHASGSPSGGAVTPAA